MSNNTQIVKTEDSLIIQDKAISLVKTKQEILAELTSALQDKWMNSDYIVNKLKVIIDSSYIINNNWDKMPDFKTMLRWIELLLKLSWVDVDTKIKVAIFNNIPKPWDRLDY